MIRIRRDRTCLTSSSNHPSVSSKVTPEEEAISIPLQTLAQARAHDYDLL